MHNNFDRSLLGICACAYRGEAPVVVEFNFNPSRLAHGEVEKIKDRMATLLDSALDNPDRAICQLNILPAAERHQVLEGFNATDADYPQDKLIHQLFEEQVARQPQAVALVYEDQQLSYGELNARANQLAHWLRGQGVGPDTLVAICLERSLEMVVGLLGILKAGGAYVPLDPAYPPARIAYMLEDAGPTVVLTQARLIETLPQTQARILALDRDWHIIAAGPDTNLDPAALGLNPHHLAYVIYTSGSTGMPKGVMVEHGNVVNFWKSFEEEIYRNHPDCTHVSGDAPLSFDASVKAYMQLFSGRTLVVVPEDIRLDAEALE